MNINIVFGDFIFGNDSAKSGIPVPRMTTSLSNNRTQSEQYFSSTRTINLDGYVTGFGAPDILENCFRIQSALITSDPQQFKFQLLDNSTPITILSGTGYVTSLQFDTEKSRGTQLATYQATIELDATISGSPINSGNQVYHVNSVEDNISISVSNDKYNHLGNLYPLYNITRTISAQGRRNYVQSGAIVEALRWINDRRITFPFTGLVPTGTFPLFNHARDINIDELQGSITITDKFVSKPKNPEQPWIDNYTASTQLREDFTNEVSIKGSIKGLEPVTGSAIFNDTFIYQTNRSGQNCLYPVGRAAYSNASGSKYNYALSGYNNITGLFYGRASGAYALISGLPINRANLPLNPTPTNYTEGFSPNNGEITYSFSYDNRPSSYISGAISELISVSDNAPLPRQTSINVLGRRLGPVVYFYTASSGLGTRSVSYEGVFATPTGLGTFTVNMDILKAIDNLLETFKPANYDAYVTANDQKINLGENRITRNKTWSYTKE